MESGGSGDAEGPWSLEAQVAPVYRKLSCDELFWEKAYWTNQLMEDHLKLLLCMREWDGCSAEEVAQIEDEIPIDHAYLAAAQNASKEKRCDR